MHRGMLKCSQFSLASPNQWSFLIWQRTAPLKRNSVPFNQLIGCFKKDLISLSCLSVIQHILVYKSQVCLMMQFLCNKHTAASRTFPCCSNHLVSNIKLFVIFLCAFALNKHIFLSSRPRLVFLMRLLLLLFFVAASSWLRFDVIVCHCLSSFVCSSLWILFVSRIHFVFTLFVPGVCGNTVGLCITEYIEEVWWDTCCCSIHIRVAEVSQCHRLD